MSVKPTSSPTKLPTKPIHTQASAKSAAITTTATRGPRRSIKRPTKGSEKEPASVPSVYRSDTAERDSPKSAMILSRKTDTPTVWPGVVIIMPKVPAKRMTQP